MLLVTGRNAFLSFQITETNDIINILILITSILPPYYIGISVNVFLVGRSAKPIPIMQLKKKHQCSITCLAIQKIVAAGLTTENNTETNKKEDCKATAATSQT
jgi:hypothetical protein